MTQMTLATLQLEQQSSKQTSFRYLEAQYGDGYTARRQDGLYPVSESWRVTTPTMPASEAVVLEAEIIALGTGFFSWQAPDEATESDWIIDPLEWSRDYDSCDFASLSFTVRRFYS